MAEYGSIEMGEEQPKLRSFKKSVALVALLGIAAVVGTGTIMSGALRGSVNEQHAASDMPDTPAELGYVPKEDATQGAPCQHGDAPWTWLDILKVSSGEMVWKCINPDHIAYIPYCEYDAGEGGSKDESPCSEAHDVCAKQDGTGYVIYETIDRSKGVNPAGASALDLNICRKGGDQDCVLNGATVGDATACTRCLQYHAPAENKVTCDNLNGHEVCAGGDSGTVQASTQCYCQNIVRMHDPACDVTDDLMRCDDFPACTNLPADAQPPMIKQARDCENKPACDATSEKSTLAASGSVDADLKLALPCQAEWTATCIDAVELAAAACSGDDMQPEDCDMAVNHFSDRNQLDESVVVTR